ncbi:MAG: mechanosensitive ion channel [Bacteroidetes bacterium]|nr:mechanosensitive ion channel [Bacteroidota bacterium]
MQNNFSDFITEALAFLSSSTAVNLYYRIGNAALFLILALGIFWVLHKLFPPLYKKLQSERGKYFRSIVIRGRTILSRKAISSFTILVLQAVRFIISAAVVYETLLLILSQFPFMESLDIKEIVSGFITSLFIIVFSVLIIRALQRFYQFMFRQLQQWKGTRIQSLKFSSVELFSEERIISILKITNSLFRFFSVLLVLYFTVTLIFNQFEVTRSWSAALFNYILSPLNKIFITFVEYLPNLFSVLVILFVTRYAIKLLKFIFDEIEKGTISLPNFHEEWIQPTYQIARTLIIIFAVIVIFPYLPGSNSPFFQGISVFLGLLFSLGSSSAISNIVAGVVITYMRPFKIGDKIKIADTIGKVVEKNLLVTRIRTNRNIDVTIPNSMTLGSHIINYSARAHEDGLILPTTVTIGYDAPWRQVHKLLMNAAVKTEGVLKKPEPFILQTNLNDYNISYELNVYTHEPGAMADIYSHLHQHIQDEFNKAGVEIMSPSFTAVRDGNTITIPEEQREKNYETPSFQISLKQKK